MHGGKTINILLLGGSNRVALARRIKEAGKDKDIEVNLFSYEYDKDVPLAGVSTVIISRKWKDNKIMLHLRNIVEGYHIDALLPLEAMASEVAARFIDAYNDTYSPVTNPHSVALVNDKVELAHHLNDLKFPIPEIYSGGRPSFPLLARPREYGPGLGDEIVREIYDFRRFLKMQDQYVMQQYIEGGNYFTVDCFVSRIGQMSCVSPRLLIHNGSITVESEEIKELCTKVMNALHLRGCFAIELVADKEKNKIYVIDILPVMALGVGATIHAGGDIPGMILDEICELIPSPSPNIKIGVKMMTYPEEIFMAT